MSDKLNDGEFVAALGMDGEKWAQAFGERFERLFVLPSASDGAGFIHHSDLVGWFANAIMAGYDHGWAKAHVDMARSLVEAEGAQQNETDGAASAKRAIATLVVPRHDNDGVDLSAEHSALQVELISLFEGYTATAATGAWRDGRAIYREDVTKYEIALRGEPDERTLQRIAARLARQCRQDCIAIWLPDGTMICVDGEGAAR